MTTNQWLNKFNGNVAAAIEEREIWFAESGADRELDFNPEDDPVYQELVIASHSELVDSYGENYTPDVY